VARRLITPTFVFLPVCYVLFAPCERTKLTAQSVKCVFLCYSAKHKVYHCWDPVTRRMRTSRDVVFDESHSFYPYPTTDVSPASLVDPLSFLLFPDTPTSLPIPRSPLPSFVSSSEPPPVVLDYTVKPLVTQFYSRHGVRLSDAPASSDELSSDVPSSSFIEDVPSSPPIAPSSPIDSSPEQLVRCSHAFIGHLTVTLLWLSQSLLFVSQLLIVMLFFIRNGNT
jgi:hypothetical protein